VSAIQYQLHLQYPHEPVNDDVVPRSLNEDLAGNVKKPLNLMLCAVGCMLLIGCLNVSNLLVARGAARQREVAIRSALGRAASYFDSRAVDRERADLRGRRPGGNPVVGT
jgi:hypothetical protein